MLVAVVVVVLVLVGAGHRALACRLEQGGEAGLGWAEEGLVRLGEAG